MSSARNQERVCLHLAPTSVASDIEIEAVRIASWKQFIDPDAQVGSLRELLARIFPIVAARGAFVITLDSYQCVWPTVATADCLAKGETYTFEVHCNVLMTVDATDQTIAPVRSSIVISLPALTDNGTFILHGQELGFATCRRLAGGVVFYEAPESEVRNIVEDSLNDGRGESRTFYARLTPHYGEAIQIRWSSTQVVEIELARDRWVPVSVLFRGLGARTERDFLSHFCVETTVRTAGARRNIANSAGEILSQSVMLDVTEDDGDPLSISPTALLYEAGSFLSPYELAAMDEAGVQRVSVYRWRKRVLLAPDGLEAAPQEGRHLASDITNPETGEIFFSAGDLLGVEQERLLFSAGFRSVEICGALTSDLVEPLIRTWRTDGVRNRQQAMRVLSAVLEIPSYDDDSVRLAIDKRLSSPRFELDRHARRRLDSSLGRDTNQEDSLTREDIVAAIARLLEFALDNAATEAGDLENFRFCSTGEFLVEAYRDAGAMLNADLRRKKKAALLRSPVDQWAVAIGRELSVQGIANVEQRCDPSANRSADFRKLSNQVKAADAEITANSGLRKVFSETHPSWYSRLCVVHGCDSSVDGMFQELAIYTRRSSVGTLLAPYRRIEEGRVSDEVTFLTPAEEWNACIATPDRQEMFQRTNIWLYRFRGEIIGVNPHKATYVDSDPAQTLCSACSQIPFLSHTHPDSARLGTSAFRHSERLMLSQNPVVVVPTAARGVESRAGKERVENGTNLFAGYLSFSGTNMANQVVVSRSVIERGELATVSNSQLYVPLSRMSPQTLGNQGIRSASQGNLDRAGIIRIGAVVRPGSILISLSQESAEAMNPAMRFLRTIFSDSETQRRDHSIRAKSDFTGVITDVRAEASDVRKLDNFLARIGEAVAAQTAAIEKRLLDSLIAFLSSTSDTSRILSAVKSSGIGCIKRKHFDKLRLEDIDIDALKQGQMGDASLRAELESFFQSRSECVETQAAWSARLFLRANVGPEGIRLSFRAARRRNLAVGDMLFTRHGGGGVVSAILPPEDMPFMTGGEPIELLLNPIQLLTQGRLGELFEAAAGFAADLLGVKLVAGAFTDIPFDEIKFLLRVGLLSYCAGPHHFSESGLRGVLEIGRRTRCYDMGALCRNTDAPGVREFLADLDLVLENAERVQSTHGPAARVAQCERREPPASRPVQAAPCDEDSATPLDARINNVLRLLGIDDAARANLRDGRTGESMFEKCTTGVVYVTTVNCDSLPQSRSVGPYALVSQQPLPSEELHGGQVVPEGMAWALAANGAAYTLQELQTVKSDDFACRDETYESIVHGYTTPSPILAAATQALLTELQGLGIQVNLGRQPVREG